MNRQIHNIGVLTLKFLAALIAAAMVTMSGCSNNQSSSSDKSQATVDEQSSPSSDSNSDLNSDSSSADGSFDIASLHTYEKGADALAGIWKISDGEGSQYEDFYYMFDGDGEAILITGTSGYFGKYSYDTDDSGNETFTANLVFGISGTYTYKVASDDKTAVLVNTESNAETEIERTDGVDFIPEADKNPTGDDEIVGCWMSDSGEYFCFDKNGIMYQNLFSYMFAYSNYTAEDGKLVSTYTTSGEKTTDEYTYEIDGDTLTLNGDTYTKTDFSSIE